MNYILSYFESGLLKCYFLGLYSLVLFISYKVQYFIGV